MTSVELADKLRKMYEIKGANKTTMIHLFGIIYGNEIRNIGIPVIEIVKAARMPESYQAEVNKGISLSRYVDLKTEYRNIY